MIKLKNNLLNYLSEKPFFLKWFFKLFKIFSNKPPVYDLKDEILDIKNSSSLFKHKVPKVIWLFWGGENIPFHIQIYVNRIYELNKEYNIVVLGFHNLPEYLREFNFSPDTPIANQTDLIRLNLLYKYGGIWIDISTILNKSLNEIFPLLDEAHNYDLIAFYNNSSTLDYNRPIIESWFLAAPKNNEFIGLWLKEFSKIELMGAKKLYTYISSRIDYEKIKQKISNPEYLLIYLTQQIVLLNKSDFNFYLKKCENSAFFYQNHYGWKPLKMHNLLINYDVLEIYPLPPIIKLVSGDRKLLPQLIESDLVDKNSIIGKMVKD